MQHRVSNDVVIHIKQEETFTFPKQSMPLRSPSMSPEHKYAEPFSSLNQDGNAKFKRIALISIFSFTSIHSLLLRHLEVRKCASVYHHSSILSFDVVYKVRSIFS